MKNEKYLITGMTCSACQANITRTVQKLPGVGEVNVSLISNQMSVIYDEGSTDSAAIIGAVQGIGYGAALKNGGRLKGEGESSFRSEWQLRKEQAESHQKEMKRRLWASIILLIPLMYISMGHMLSLPMPALFSGTVNLLSLAFTQFIITIPIVFINRHFFTSGFKALIKRMPNMDSLVAIGSGASLLYGVVVIYLMIGALNAGDLSSVMHYGHELYFESCAMILTLVTLGKFLEARSKLRTSDALGKLVDLAPKTATVIRGGEEVEILSEQVAAGDIVVIKPGGSIPVDGIVTEGYGYVDESAITGESIPVDKNVGDEIISATINKNGTFRFRASKVGEDTTLSQIIRLVDEAGNSKAPIARLADKISGIFVPVVIAIAIVTAIVWLMAGKDFQFAFNCAIAVLVISCPCALGLATPVAIMVGTGKAAEYGILIKSAESLENLHSIDTVVLDKTGTITSGRPSVTDIVVLSRGVSEREFLAEAAAVEAGSEHPLALAVTGEAKSQGIAIKTAESFEMLAGRGVKAALGGNEFLAGNAAFMRENLIISGNGGEAMAAVERLAQEGKTPLIFAKNKEIAGIIAVADTVREQSLGAINELKGMGLHVVMLTGDNHLTAESIRRQLGIEKAISDVLPTGKEACIRELQNEGHKVLMVGDGVNDAPALTRADVGIAIGAGTDVAIDSADIVLMKNSLSDVVTAITLSKAVVRNIHMNLFWAFFYNVLGIPVAAGVFYPVFGLLLSPMIGSAAMSLSSVCVVLNALRLKLFKRKGGGAIEKERDLPQRLPGEGAVENNVQNTENRPQEANRPAQISLPVLANDTKQTKKQGDVIMKKVIVVDGMMCENCQRHVTKALSAVEDVLEVTVDLESKKATVAFTSEVPDEALTAAVTEAGYTPVSCSAL